MKKFVYIFLVAMMFTPAVLADNSSFNEKAMGSWVGYTIDDVIKSWGYPTEEKTIANHHIFIWNKSFTNYVPQSSNSTAYNSFNNTNIHTTTYGGYYVNYSCCRTFEVDENNKIISWQYQGNGCANSYSRGKKLVNPQNDEWAVAAALKAKQKAEAKAQKQAAKELKAKQKAEAKTKKKAEKEFKKKHQSK